MSSIRANPNILSDTASSMSPSSQGGIPYFDDEILAPPPTPRLRHINVIPDDSKHADDSFGIMEPDPIKAHHKAQRSMSFAAYERSVSPLGIGQRSASLAGGPISPVEDDIKKKHWKRFRGGSRDLPEKHSNGEYYDYSEAGMPRNHAITQALIRGPPLRGMIWDDQRKKEVVDWQEAKPILTSKGVWMQLPDPTLEPRRERAAEQHAEYQFAEAEKRWQKQEEEELEREERQANKYRAELAHLKAQDKELDQKYGSIAKPESKGKGKGREKESLREELRMTPVSYPSEPRDVHPALRQSSGSGSGGSSSKDRDQGDNSRKPESKAEAEGDRVDEPERGRRRKREERKRVDRHVSEAETSRHEKSQSDKHDTASQKPKITAAQLDATPTDLGTLIANEARRKKMERDTKESSTSPTEAPYIREMRENMERLKLQRAAGENVDQGRIIVDPREYSSCCELRIH